MHYLYILGFQVIVEEKFRYKTFQYFFISIIYTFQVKEFIFARKISHLKPVAYQNGALSFQ